MTVRKAHNKAPQTRNVAAETTEKSEFSLIPNDTLKAFYGHLLNLRRGGPRERTSKAPDFVAADVAVAMDLRSDDEVFADRRRKALELLRGGSFRTSTAAGSRRDHFAETLRSALGTALVQRTLKHGGISVVFAGANALVGRPDVLEAARAHLLPVIFVAEQISSSDTADLAEVLRKDLPAGEEMPHIVVDGNDVVAVYRVAHEAMERARRCRGATLIECISFRVKGQRGSDSPVAVLERYLRGKNMLTRTFKEEAVSLISTKRKKSR